VLDAAERVLLTRSADTFTLDAVANEAGVSKGGLIYHFPSKEALLESLVAQAVAAVDDALAKAAASGVPGAFTYAYLELTVPNEARMPIAAPTAALVAAVALDPRLLAPLREAYSRWQARLEIDGLDPAAATAVRFAVDGWWLAALLGLPPLSADVHARTRALLADLCTPPG
jgi:AcrR family transcriptional regulator